MSVKSAAVDHCTRFEMAVLNRTSKLSSCTDLSTL